MSKKFDRDTPQKETIFPSSGPAQSPIISRYRRIGYCLQEVVARHSVLLNRHENGVPHLAVHRLRQMPLAGDVLHQDHLSGADHAGFAVARGQFHPGIEVDDVLPARGGMPGPVMLGLGLAEDDPGGGQPGRELAGVIFLGPVDLDVPPVGFTLGVAIQVVDADGHGVPPEAGRQGRRVRPVGQPRGSFRSARPW